MRIDFTEDREQIISLWSSVFGDSREDIEFFIDECKNYSCLGLFVDDTLASMLFLVDCKYSEYNGKYVYAVCTAEVYRKHGYSSSLISEAKKHMRDFLWLIPANDGLFEFYSKHGFETRLYSDGEFQNKIEFDEINEIIEYLYEGSDHEFPKGMIFSALDLPIGSTGIIR
ncbi:MAG: GNAT family N-acetyltransferase [Eubacterium sp.]|nr:GNAT family N-acetyltransferase [Eubacterium sp.]